MTVTVDATTQATAVAAAGAAANGAKNAAYLNAISTAIGANYKVLLKREGSTVYTGTATGSLSVAAGQIALPTSLGSVTVSAADIDTGSWVIRVEKAADSAVYFQSTLTPTSGSGPFYLTADLESSGTLTLGSLVFASPEFDTEASSGDSVDKIISDMGNENDAAAIGIDSYPSQSKYIWNANPALTNVTPGFTAFGNRWRIDEQADWVRNNTSIPAQYRTYPGSQCKYIDLWYVISDASGHSANNTRVKVEAASLKLRNASSKVWTTPISQDSTGQFYASKSSVQSIGGSPDVRTVGNTKEILVPAGVWNYTIHGIVAAKYYVDISLYDAVLVTYKVSLVVDNPALTDDRASAKVLIWAGADVFPTERGWDDLNGQNLPAFAHSRLMFVTSTPQFIHACNLSNARQDYTGPNASITVESLRQYPPPL